MSVKVSQMTVDELWEVIGAVVEEKLRLLFADVASFELTGEIKARLFRPKKEVEAGERGEALEDIVARLGLI